MFNVGEEVLVLSRNERLLMGVHQKLKQKHCGPDKILRKINDNVHVVDLLNNIGISKTFKVVDLTKFHPKIDIYKDDSRVSSFLVAENNGGL